MTLTDRRPRGTCQCAGAAPPVRGPKFIGALCQPISVDVTEATIARIPPGNLRVPRVDFVALWIAADQRSNDQADRGISDWAAGGVAQTCAWMANASVRLRSGRVLPPRSPITKRATLAYEELLDAELIAVDRLAMRAPPPDWLIDRTGWLEAISATLHWAWRHDGPRPLVDVLPLSG